MADKIKAFFQKKKTNVKFMNAGKGYKLSDTASTSVPCPVREPIKRVEPTEEAKVAGQAALARLEAKATPTIYNRSYAAIKSQVLRELEEEKKAQQKTQQNTTRLEQEPEESVTDKSLLAVTDVYFRCPYLSDEVLSKEEWKSRIKTFLYDQLEGEEPGLTACLVIQNCNPKREKVESCIETLGKYLENIINNPEAEKYRRIRMHNRIFQEKVRPIEGVMDFLHAAGFRETKLLHNDVEEDFLLWSPENCDIESLIILESALKTAESFPLELDRNIQVLMPTQAGLRTELPASFYNIIPEEIQREQQLRTEAIERSQMLRTKAMRERDGKQRLRKYKYSLIRIKFPDDIILQGTFFIHDKFRVVFNFVSENIANSETPFCLTDSIGKKFNESCFDKTLLELELFPAVYLVFVPVDELKKPTNSAGYLKEELLSHVQFLKYPIL